MEIATGADLVAQGYLQPLPRSQQQPYLHQRLGVLLHCEDRLSSAVEHYVGRTSLAFL